MEAIQFLALKPQMAEAEVAMVEELQEMMAPVVDLAVALEMVVEQEQAVQVQLIKAILVVIKPQEIGVLVAEEQAQ